MKTKSTLFVFAVLLLFTSLRTDAQWVTTGPYGAYVFSLASKPGGLVFAGTSGGTVYAGGNYGLFRTTDGGQSWKSLRRSALSGLAIPVPGRVLATNIFGLMISTDGGESWPVGDSTVSASSFCMSGQWLIGGGDRYTANGIVRSSDLGATWTESNTGLTNLAVGPLLVDGSGSILAVAGGAMIFRSSDGGGTWSRLWKGFGVNESIQCLSIGPSGALYALIQTYVPSEFSYWAGSTIWPDEIHQSEQAPFDEVTLLLRVPDVLLASGTLLISDMRKGKATHPNSDLLFR